MNWGNTNNVQQIIVTEGKIEHLATLYRKTWQREPTKEELEHVVQEYIFEQAAYYEGVNLGLDRNDIVISRRIRQKIDFLAEDNIALPEVTDELLASFLENNAEKFRHEPQLSIRQIYFDPNEHNEDAEIKSLLNQLLEDPKQDITNLGDSFLFKTSYQNKTLTDLERIFGRGFAKSCEQLLLDQWDGPITSSFGLHLVQVVDKQASYVPELEEIRSQVLMEWEQSLRDISTKEYYDQLLIRYPVSIDWPSKYSLESQ